MSKPSSLPPLSQQQAMRYSRQILLQGFDLDKQEILLVSRVLVIGVGGLGCACSQYLVAAGVGHLTLVDDDQVELTNLQRQVLHREQDIGESKCRSARQSLLEINSEVSIHTIEKRLDEKALAELVAEHDLVVDCTDNLESRNLINRQCVAKGVALVSGAAIRMEGQISSFIPAQDGPCYQCLSHFFGEQQLSCVESGVMSPVVGVVGAMQALEGIKILCHYGTPLVGKLLLFDAMDSSWRTFNLPRRPDCPVCKVA